MAGVESSGPDVYIAFNRSSNIVSGEREAMGFDVNRVLGRRIPSAWYASAGKTKAEPWQGKVVTAGSNVMTLAGAVLQPHAYAGLDVLILDGVGAGQTARIADNAIDTVTVDSSWKVSPEAGSLVLLFQLSGESIGYRNSAADTSGLLLVWGYLYDLTLDSNEVNRSQGMWATSGWFIQWLDNRLVSAVTFHKGVGPSGTPGDTTPEQGASFGYVGFTIVGMMTTLPQRFPFVRGAVIRGNILSYGYRILVMLGYGGPRRRQDL